MRRLSNPIGSSIRSPCFPVPWIPDPLALFLLRFVFATPACATLERAHVPARAQSAPKSADPFACFHPVTAAWFKAVFDAPTAPQRMGWPVIARGENALILAPTGTGKTLAAFLWCLDRLMLEDRDQGLGTRTRESRRMENRGHARLPHRLCFAAEGAGRGRGAEPALAAGRHGQHGAAHGRRLPRAGHQRAHRRHAAARARPLRAASR